MSEGTEFTQADAVAGLQAASGEGTPDTSPAPNNPVNQPPANSGTSTQGHPAWQGVLSKIPEGFHNIVRPAFEEWDKGVQSKIQSVHSQYAPFKPFLDQGINPDQLQQAHQLYQLLNENPRQIYDGLREHFGFEDSEQGQSDGDFDLGESEDQRFDPRVDQLAQQQEMIANHIQQQQQQAEQQQAETWVDTSLKEVSKALEGAGLSGDDPGAMRYILTNALGIYETTGKADGAFEQATQDYMALVNHVRSAPRAADRAPSVLPTSGGTPSNVVNPAEMGSKERRQLGVDWLKSALGQSGG